MTSENNLYVEKNKAEVSKNVPELRFQGFIDAWEQRELDSLATFSKGSGYSKGDLGEKGSPIILYGRLYTKYETLIKDVDTFVVPKGNSVISEGNEVIVPASGETSEDISRAAVVGKSGILLGGDLNIIKPKSNLNSVFLAFTISNGSQQKELSTRAQGNSVVHLYNSELKKVNLLFPSLEEQEKIGSFFIHLDHLIALHQRKLDKLKLLKKGYLQQIFPQNGEKVPRVRFTNFENEWEPRKLKDLGIIQTGNTPKTSNAENYNENGVLWITPTDIEYLITNNSAKKLSAEGYSKARIADSGSILVTCIASIGKNTLVEEPSGFNQQINSLTPNKLNNSYFLLTQSELWSTKMKGIASSGTMQIVNKNDFSNLLFLYPKLEEQKKIGSFFKQLDYTIALHQSKLDKLNTLKQGLLQKMFL